MNRTITLPSPILSSVGEAMPAPFNHPGSGQVGFLTYRSDPDDPPDHVAVKRTSNPATGDRTIRVEVGHVARAIAFLSYRSQRGGPYWRVAAGHLAWHLAYKGSVEAAPDIAWEPDRTTIDSVVRRITDLHEEYFDAVDVATQGLKLAEESGEVARILADVRQGFSVLDGLTRADLGTELADVIIVASSIAGALSIRLDKAVETKLGKLDAKFKALRGLRK